MLLQIDDDDIQILDDVLGQHLRTLLLEIAHADDRVFRDALRERYEHLEAIRRQFSAVTGVRSPGRPTLRG